MAESGASHGIARTSGVRSEEQRQKDLERIDKYRQLEDEVRQHVAKQKFSSPEVFQLTSKLLRLNPEYYTVWNVRRRCLISGLFSKQSLGSSCSTESWSSSRCDTTATSSVESSSSSLTATPPSPAPLTAGKSGTTVDEGDADADAEAEKKDFDLIKSELYFTIPLLLESPKCYWIWSYRLWVLNQAIERLPAPVARRIWEEELGLASKMLLKDRRNFHAWGYRRHVVAQLESPALGGGSMVEAEFEYTEKMFRTDLSNFSALHNRSQLIPRLLDERGATDAQRKAFLDKELNMIRDALNVGPEDQSLWYYHQFLVLNIVTTVGRPTITPAFTLEERISYVSREIEEIKDLLEDYEDVQLIYEALVDYTLYLSRLEERKPTEEEREDLVSWVGQLKELDPMRNGRWADLERDQGLVELLPGGQ
ncbi:geranylgeranyl transferase type-2 subunit alpha [Cladorrhinum sp. PSN259]|nr:geranylgeranyl transferase type-2 subunit alpha [Cladorrhinum sp. PSN259]